MKIKKSLSVAVALVILAGIVTSCTKAPSSSSSAVQSTSNGTSQSEVQEPAREPGYYPNGEKAQALDTVATVGDIKFDFTEFRYAYLTVIAQMTADGKLDEAAAKEEAINFFKQTAAIEMLVEENDIKMTEADQKLLDEYIASLEAQFEGDEFENALKTMHYTKELFLTHQSRSILFSNYVATKYKDDIKKNVDENYVHIKHILVMMPEGATDEQKAETKKKADDIYEKTKGEQTFEDLRKEYDEDPGQPDEGYYFTYKEMLPEFEDKAFEMELGEISEPVLTTKGYHILKKYEFDNEEFEKNIVKYISEDVNAAVWKIVDDKMASLDVKLCDEWDKINSKNIF